MKLARIAHRSLRPGAGNAEGHPRGVGERLARGPADLINGVKVEIAVRSAPIER